MVTFARSPGQFLTARASSSLPHLRSPPSSHVDEYGIAELKILALVLSLRWEKQLAPRVHSFSAAQFLERLSVCYLMNPPQVSTPFACTEACPCSKSIYSQRTQNSPCDTMLPFHSSIYAANGKIYSFIFVCLCLLSACMSVGHVCDDAYEHQKA